jgi:post-segregation antitoxin (ccd killing protein)
VPAEASVAVVSGVVGLVSAFALSLINSAISARAGIDEGLRAKRLSVYPALWEATRLASRWPRRTVRRSELDELHRALRDWYYAKGGMYLSETARARYGDLQELIAAALTHSGDPGSHLNRARYEDLMEVCSAMRTAITEDLDTRRRKSWIETNRRARWHARAHRIAQDRIEATADSQAVFELRDDTAEG